MGLGLIFGLLDLIDKIDNFMPHNPSLWKLASYAVLEIPGYLLYLLPMSGLLCGLFVFAQASKAKETVAVMASGGRLRRLLLPLVLAGVFISIFSFALGEFIVPVTSGTARNIKKSITGIKDSPLFREGAIWLRAKDGSIVHMELYLEDTKSAKGISIFGLDEEGIKERIDAGEAVYAPPAWLLKDVKRYDIRSGAVWEADELPYPGITSPEFFEEDVKKPDEMGFMELRAYIKKINDAGIKNHKLTVDMNSKTSYPVLNLFMLVLGVSLSVRRSMSGLVSASVGIALSLAYWFGYTFSLSLGYAGIIPPVIAAWTVPLIFGGIAFYLFMGIPE